MDSSADLKKKKMFLFALARSGRRCSTQCFLLSNKQNYQAALVQTSSVRIPNAIGSLGRFETKTLTSLTFRSRQTGRLSDCHRSPEYLHIMRPQCDHHRLHQQYTVGGRGGSFGQGACLLRSCKISSNKNVQKISKKQCSFSAGHDPKSSLSISVKPSSRDISTLAS